MTRSILFCIREKSRLFLAAFVSIILMITGGCQPAAVTEDDHGPAVILTSENFEAIALKSDKPVLVDFWASWCAPCVALGPTISELATEYEGRAVVAKLNVDDFPELAGRYQVSSIPALKVFRQGKVIDQIVGPESKGEIEEMLKKALR